MSTKAAAKSKEVDLEKALTQLEALVERMESGKLSLDDSLKAFEEGVKLTRACQTKLAEAEQRVQILMQEQGEWVAKEFAEAADDE